MEAYWFDVKDSERTVAKPNTDPFTTAEFRGWDWSEPIPEEMTKYYPTEAWTRSRCTPPSSWAGAFGYAVSPEVKAAIEELEPNVHQFIPVTIKCGTRAKHTEYPYYSLRINQRIDDVLTEKSDVEWRTVEREDGTILRLWSKKQAPLVLPLSSIKGKHLWWNRATSRELCMMSGDLYHRLVDRGLTKGLRFQQQIVE